MKKTLIALAALGVVGAASAQVALTGSIGYGVQTSVSGNGSNNTKAHFHMTDADITFSGSEDLGGGMSVSASLGFSNEAGRGGNPGVENTSLSLTGGFGTITANNFLSGRAKMGSASLETDLSDYLGGYSNVKGFEYKTPALTGDWQAFMSWSSASAATATTTDLEASGSPYIGVTGTLAGASIYLDNNTGSAAEGWDLRVKYDLGAAVIAVRTSKDKYQEFGVSVPMGAMTVSVNTANQKNGATDNQGTSLGIAYAMSKQTSLSFGYGTGKGDNAGQNYRLNLVKKF